VHPSIFLAIYLKLRIEFSDVLIFFFSFEIWQLEGGHKKWAIMNPHPPMHHPLDACMIQLWMSLN
jgi:hypothetical protein